MKKITALLLAVAMIASLTACGGNTTSSSSSGGEPTPSGSQATPATKKDTLVIGQYGDTPNFDTHNNLNDNGMRINTCIYDPLVRMNNITYEIEPCVAESWTVSPDGKEYTFKIKAGIKFSDGTDMQISDVVYSLNRGMVKPMAVPSFARVKGVEAVGTDSVKVTLDGPYAEFLYAMALPTAGIMSEKATVAMNDDLTKSPITTGPYVVKDWKVGEKVILEANQYYHMGTVPIKTVEWRVVTDPNAAVISVESGDIDAYVDIQQSSTKRLSTNDKVKLYQGQAFGYSMVQINTSKPPFDNIKARQALAHAIDKESILYGIMDGNGEMIDTFARPEYVGYTDAVTKYPYDVEKSKALFTEAGAMGKEIEILAYNERMSKNAQVIQNSLAEVGITAKIKLVERSAFDELCVAGNTQIIVEGATFTSPSIDDAIYTAVHSSQFEVRNYSKYKNPAVDKLLDDARITVSDTDRAKLYQELLVTLSNDLPIIPVIWNSKNIVANKDLKNVSINPWSFYNVYDFSW